MCRIVLLCSPDEDKLKNLELPNSDENITISYIDKIFHYYDINEIKNTIKSLKERINENNENDIIVLKEKTEGSCKKPYIRGVNSKTNRSNLLLYMSNVSYTFDNISETWSIEKYSSLYKGCKIYKDILNYLNK